MKYLVRTKYSYLLDSLVDADSPAQAEAAVKVWRPTAPTSAFEVLFDVVSCTEQPAPPSLAVPAPAPVKHERTDAEKFPRADMPHGEFLGQ